MGKNFVPGVRYALFAGPIGVSPSSATTYNYLYYKSVSGHTSTIVNFTQKGSAGSTLQYGQMWVMVQEDDGEYQTLDGLKWTKVVEYWFG